MKYLEIILNFLTGLARIIFPRKRKPAAGNCPSPHPFPRPLPDGDHPDLAPDETNGGDADSHRSDTLALYQGHWGTNQKVNQKVEPVDIAAYCLMAGGLGGSLYKLFTA